MKRIAFILTFLSACLINQGWYAQEEKTVKWTYSAEAVDNGEVLLHFKAVIDKTWHM